MRKLRHWRPLGVSRALWLVGTVWMSGVITMAFTRGLHG